MNIKEMSVNDLKALAYDELAKIEQAQKNLQIINARIVEKLNEPKEEPKSE